MNHLRRSLGNLKEILAYGIVGLYERRGRVYNVFLYEPFFVDSLNRAVLEENRSIKTASEPFLCHFIGNVNYLAWPRSLGFILMPSDSGGLESV
jgi:hypothetical protein